MAMAKMLVLVRMKFLSPLRSLAKPYALLLFLLSLSHNWPDELYTKGTIAIGVIALLVPSGYYSVKYSLAGFSTISITHKWTTLLPIAFVSYGNASRYLNK